MMLSDLSSAGTPIILPSPLSTISSTSPILSQIVVDSVGHHRRVPYHRPVTVGGVDFGTRDVAGADHVVFVQIGFGQYRIRRQRQSGGGDDEFHLVSSLAAVGR